MKNVFLLAVMVFGFSFAQDAVADAPATSGFDLSDPRLVPLYLALLGVLSIVAQKIPGKVGKAVRWFLDLISANVQHK